MIKLSLKDDFRLEKCTDMFAKNKSVYKFVFFFAVVGRNTI